MKGFFKFTFASILGVLIGLVIFIFIILGIIGISAREKPVVIKENTVLVAKLNQPIVDRSPEPAFGNFNPDMRLGLDMILDNLEKAREDPNIAGILLDISVVPAGSATIEEIRNGLLNFKSSGKFVICYADILSHKSYYLATAADKIYMTPEGLVQFTGLASRNIFFKKAFDKLGVKPEAFRIGVYKGYAEPFIFTKLSDENRSQIKAFTSSIWNTMLENIASARSISIDSLNIMANEMAVTSAESALQHHFIDGLKYRDEINTELKTMTEVPEKDDLKTVSMSEYAQVPKIRTYKGLAKNKIAVVYATGDIVPGNSSYGKIGGESFTKAIRKARRDSTIKAIVLRVNSGGGSSLESDLIWREVKLASETKPVIASMGDVAASGGYYILANSTKIYADPTTITGSIGVVAMFYDLQDLMNDKLGITYDVVKTNENSDFGSVFRPLNPTQRMKIQNEIERTYKSFITHVAEGRNMTPQAVDEIGRGHVYSAVDAQKLGLVDELGGFTEAIAAAADAAGIETYRIVKYPEIEMSIQKLLSQVTDNMQSRYLKKKLGENYPVYEQLEEFENIKGIQTRIPYSISIE